MGAQRHINGHTGAHVIAQHFDDFANRFSAAGRTLAQLNDDDKAHPRAHHLFRWNQDVKAQAAIVRHHKTNASIGEIAAHNLAGFWHQHAYDARFTAAFTIGTQRLGQDLVTVDAHLHLFRREIQVIFAAFDAQEAEAITVTDYHAFQQIETFGQGIALTAGKD
ncbi:hypothetical protein D3C75_491700 [compost metagenome]